MNIPAQIEALLFFKGEPLTIGEIAKLIGASAEEVNSQSEELAKMLAGRGISLIRTNATGSIKDNTLELRTSPEAHAFIEKITKEELSRDLGKAGLETLSIVLYRGPIKRSDVDYIRGVSSQYIIRSLLVRGLIAREVDPKDSRSIVYAPTTDLLAMLGVTKAEDLPDYKSVSEEWEKQQQALQPEKDETQP